VLSRPQKPRRRHLSILLVEIALTTALDPEVATRRLSRARAVVRAALEQHGALVMEPLGDTIIGAFGLPAAREDDALRSMMAASDLPAIFGGLELGFRAAIDTTEALADDVGLRDDQVPGRMMRLTTRAVDGETVLSDAALRLVRDRVRVRRIRNSDVWRLQAVEESAARGRHSRDTPLIGREAELGRLLEAFEWVERTRRCHLVTLIGVAGIGKTRLADELAAKVRRRGSTLRGRCMSYRSGTFLPLTEMVMEAAGGTDRPSLEKLLSAAEDARAVIDQLEAALAPTAGARAEDAFWAFRRMFNEIARAGPLVLIFEDLHWGEERLLQFIDDLACRSSDRPILILCLARSELLERGNEWGKSVSDSETLRLGPLLQESSEVLLALAGDDLAPDVRQRIIDRAEGNALFIEQMAALMAENPSTPPGTIPLSIHAVLSARLDRLDSIDRTILEAAAVVGTQFTLAELCALAQDPVPEDLAERLEWLVERELIRPAFPDERRSDRWRFWHVLVRDAVYGALLKAERAELHERFARWLESTSKETAETDRVVGQHLEKVYLLRTELDPGDVALAPLAAEAGRKLVSAGQREAQRSDTSAAIELLTRGLRLVGEDDPSRGAGLADLAYTARLTGEWDIVRDSLEQGFTFAAQAGDAALSEYLTASELQFRLHTEPNFDVEEIVRTASRSLRALEQVRAEPYTARVRVVLAWAYALRGQCSAAERLISLSTTKLPEARRLLPTLWLYGPLRVDDVRRRCRRLLDEQPDPRTSASCYRALAVTEAMCTKFEDAREYARRARSIVEELGLTVMAAASSAVVASVELMAGDPVQAERELRLPLQYLQRLGATMHTGGMVVILADALHEQGRHEEASAAVESAEAAASRDVVDRVRLHIVRSKLLSCAQRFHESVSAGQEALAIADGTDSPALRGDAHYRLGLALHDCQLFSEAVHEMTAAVALFEAKGTFVSASQAKSHLGGG